MTLTWIAVNYVLTVNRAGSLWRTQGQRSVSPTFQSLSQRLHVKRPFCRKAGRLCWRQIHSTKRKGLRGWFCRDSHLRYKLVSPTSISHFSTSACCGSLSLSQRMSRIRSTLDSVSKAVSGTHTDLLSRIARLKPGATQGGKTECPEGKAASAAAKEAPGLEEKKLPPTGGPSQDGGKPNATLTTPGSGAPSGSTITRQTAELFHPSNFAPNLDETYSYLAHHVNTYFGSTPAMDEKQKQSSVAAPKPNPDQIPLLAPVSAKLGSDSAPAAHAPASPSSGPVAPPPATPTAPKKGIGHYLSYPGPSMQAFVGNYLTPLVPKFRSDSRSITAEKDRASPEDGEALSQQGEAVKVEEQPVSDDKTRRLLLQREKIIARMSVDNRTRGLVRALQRASDVKIYISRVEELSCHLLEFPETRGVAVKEKVIPCLLRLRQAGDPALQAAVREALALVGYTDPVKGRGIRVLTIDGGGTRGLVALQTLHKLEDLTGKPIYQLFDYICGVSTGAILAFMLGVYQIPLVECEELYRRLGSDVFKQNVIVGTVKMGWSHAFYDSQIWEAILKERMGSDVMIETSRNPKCPKVAAVSTIVNRGTPLKAYVFRNYSMQPGIRSHYLGGCQHQLWQAIRASSAAPGYFQEFVLGSDLHQDGGLLINNPTALAIHECKCLWPNTPVQCVVSLGTGRYEAGSKNSATYTSLKTKLSHVISSATDTEEVHTMLDALLPPNTYFRFNPYMTEDIALDESRKEKLNLLQAEGKRYLERNEEKLRKAAGILTQEKSAIQRLAEWVKLKGDMYDGLPFFSKL